MDSEASFQVLNVLEINSKVPEHVQHHFVVYNLKIVSIYLYLTIIDYDGQQVVIYHGVEEVVVNVDYLHLLLVVPVVVINFYYVLYQYQINFLHFDILLLIMFYIEFNNYFFHDHISTIFVNLLNNF